MLEADHRVAACWLEGSFASETTDAWSDIDMHVAVRDDNFDTFLADRLHTLNRIRTVLAYGEASLPWSAHLVYATMSGPVRFDLYIERLDNLEAVPRWEEPRLLFQREAIGSRLQVVTDISTFVRSWLEGLMQSFFFGAMWPVRLWGREEWGTLLMNSLAITYQFLVPAMMVQDDPRNYYRPPYHNEHRLRPERRQEINALLEEILRAFRGIGRGEVDFEGLVHLHEVQFGLLWRELRVACTKWGVTYPEVAEKEMQDYYRRELGFNIKSV